MTAAFDAFTKIATATGTSSGGAPLTGTHTPSGTPRGVIVYIHQSASGAGGDGDDVSAVTYGGVSMSRVTTAADTAGETMRPYAYFLGASIPTGAQTVTVTYSGGLGTRILYCISVTASADTEVDASNITEGDQADPDITVATTASTNCFVSGILSTGESIHTNISSGSGYTELDLTDVSSRASNVQRRTSNSTGGNVSVLWSTSAIVDDVAAIGVAIKESAASAFSLVTLIRKRRG